MVYQLGQELYYCLLLTTLAHNILIKFRAKVIYIAIV